MQQKCLIWGCGADYSKLYNLIKYEELKSNISIEAMVSKDSFQYIYDGWRVISSADVSKIEFDYIIVTSSKYYKEIVADAEKIAGGRIREKIIDGRVMYIPGFDFAEYVKLRKSPVSIIANNCLGGILYSYLDLKFSSPFINCWMTVDDFLLLINNLEEYMKQPLVQEYEGDIYQYPIGSLTYLHKKIKIRFIHTYSFEEAKSDFERRRKRINWDNIFICSKFSSKEYAKKFEQIHYKKKNFTIEDFGEENSILMLGYGYEYNKRKKDATQARDFSAYLNDMNNLTKEINVLQMLLGEDEIRRYCYLK